MSPTRTRTRHTLITLVLATLLAMMLVPLPATPAEAAEAGDLDTGFGTDGITSFGPVGVVPADDILIQDDGGIVVPGTTAGGDVFLGRLTPDGTQDTTFNGGGWITSDLGSFEAIQGAALQPDGRIVVAGWRDVSTSSRDAERDLFVARFNRNGTSDFSFAGTGNRRIDVAGVLGDPAAPLNYIGNVDEGRSVAVVDVDGTTRILVAGTTTKMGGDSEPGDQRFFVARFDLDGALDTTFGEDTNGDGIPDGITAVDLTPGDDWANDMAVAPDGRIVVVGFASNPDNVHDVGIVRLSADGLIDDTFGDGDGIVIHDTNSREDGARSVVIDADGVLTVSGYQSAISGIQGMVARYHGDGSVDGSFGDGGVLTVRFADSVSANAGSLAFDAAGRVILAAQHLTPDTRLGVARISGSGYDDGFSTDGRAIFACGEPGGGTGIVQAPTGRILAAAQCGNRATVVAVHASTSGPAVTDVSLSVLPQGGGGSAETLAGQERVDLSNLDPADLVSAGVGAQAAPMRNTPMRNTPMRNTPMRNTPMRNTPMRNTPMRNTPIHLSSIPLVGTTWETLLEGTKFEGAPLQTVTLLDVLELEPSPVDELSIEEMDLRHTPMRNTTMAGLLLGQIPLEDLPEPNGGWCTVLAGQPRDCTNGADPTTSTLFELELYGDDLSAYYAQPLELVGIELAPEGAPHATLATILLKDMYLDATPMGAVPADEVADLLTCGSACPPTLHDANEAGVVRVDATLGQLIELLPLPSLDSLSLGEVIPGLLEPGAFPFENVPLETILQHAAFRTDPATLVGVTLGFDLDCSAAFEDLSAEVALGAGFRAVPGSASLSVPVGTAPAELAASGTTGSFRVSMAEPCGAATGTHRVTLSFDAEPGVRLGWTPEEAVAEVRWTPGGASEPESATAVGGRAFVLETRESYSLELDDGYAAAPGNLYTGHLSYAGDVDVFAIPAPPAGSRLTVSISHLPDDYDLVLYGPDGGIETSPMRNTPMRNTPMRNTGLPDAGGEGATDDTHLAPEGLQDIPMRNTPMRNTSINRGTDTESTGTIIRESDAGGTFHVQISGFDGAHSDDPYLLRVSTDPAPPPLPCATRNLSAVAPTSTVPTADPTHETLILVNPSRLDAVHGSGSSTDLMAELDSLAHHPLVQGLVVPLDADADVNAAYDAWDDDPCDVSAANDVVGSINAFVDSILDIDGDGAHDLSGLRHLVIVGGDEIIPQGRLIDGAHLGNESEYARDPSFGGQDNPVSRALAGGYLLSDDPYGDLDPIAWQSGELYVPDVALGRLVETPVEMLATVKRFLDPNVGGKLDPSTSFVSGYDFLKDGAQAVQDGIQAKVPNGPTRIDETWDSAAALGGIVASAGGLTSVNAHYDHYRALPAQAFNTDGLDVLSTAALGTTDLTDSILFTMGCHAGLSVMDVFVTGSDDEGRAHDWAQATSARGGLFVGNTGFGYGDTDVVGYSEKLMADFAANVASGQMTVGQALMYAKQSYIGELGVVGVYDAKVVEQTTFYGLPMYRIGAQGGVAAPAVPAPAGTNATQVTQETVSLAPAFTEVGADRGRFWLADGAEPQVSHYRPIQPRVTLDVPLVGTQRARGAVIEALSSTDIAGVDPVYARPTIDLSAVEPEPVVTEVAFPSTIQRIVNTATPEGPKDTLVLMPGQFFTPEASADGTGVQRLWTSIEATVYRSDSDDFDPPVITSTDAYVSGPGAQFVVHSPSADVTRAVVLWRDDVSSTWRKLELSSPVGSDRWSGGAGMASSASEVREYFVQLVDEAGNVGISTNKGFRYRSEELPAPKGLEIAVSPAPHGGGYYIESPTISVGSDGEGTALFEYRVNGGEWVAYSGAFSLGADIGEGAHVVEFRGDDGSSGTVLVPIDRTGPQITVTSPSDGARYEVGSEVIPDFVCADGLSGVASCEGPTAIDTSRGEHTFTVTARDRAGHVTVRAVTYSAEYAWEGFFSPVTNGALNEARGGSAVPVKFRLRGSNDVVASDTSLVVVTDRFVNCGTGATIGEVNETVPTAGNSGLTYDETNQHFVYVYKSAKSWAGQCTTVSVTVDNAVHEVTFRWKR